MIVGVGRTCTPLVWTGSYLFCPGALYPSIRAPDSPTPCALLATTLSAQSCRNRGQGGGRHWVSYFIPLGVPLRSLTLDPTTAGSDSFTLTYATTSMMLPLLVGPNSINLSDSNSRNNHNITSLVDTLIIKSTLKDITLFGHAAYVIFYVSSARGPS